MTLLPAKRSATQQEGHSMTDRKTSMAPDARDETTSVRHDQTLGSVRWVLLMSMIAMVISFVVAFAVMPMS